MTDIPIMNGAAIVARQRLERIGFKVLLKGMNWAADQAVRANKDPPEQRRMEPYSDVVAIPGCQQSCCPFRHIRRWRERVVWLARHTRLENLITDWVRAPDQVGRHRIAEAIQKVAMDEVPYVPWGEYVAPWACRKNLRDFVRFGPPVFWNVKIT